MQLSQTTINPFAMENVVLPLLQNCNTALAFLSVLCLVIKIYFLTPVDTLLLIQIRMLPSAQLPWESISTFVLVNRVGTTNGTMEDRDVVMCLQQQLTTL
jgi:hypothetical protein